MTCPACGSAEVRKLSDLWDEFRSGTGTSVARIETAISAQLPDSGAAPDDRQEAVRTLLVRELAPPERKFDLPLGGSCFQMSLSMGLILVGLALVIVGSIRMAHYQLGIRQILFVILSGIVTLVLGYTIGRFAFPKRTYRQYEERLGVWQRSYRCMQCGTHFAADA